MLKSFYLAKTQDISMWLGISSFLVVFGVLTLFFLTKGAYTVGYPVFNPLMVKVAGTVSFLIVFVCFLRLAKTGSEIEQKYFLPLGIVVGVGYAFALGILGYLFSIIFSTAFRNMTFDFVSAPFLLAAFGGILAYLVAESIWRFDRHHFAYLIVLEFLFGFFLAAIKNGDNKWWNGSTCSLGMPVNKTPIYFNFTLVLTGALLALFAIYLEPTTEHLKSKKILSRSRVNLLTILYFSLTVALILLGLMPFGVNSWINKVHVFVGDGIFVVFAIFLAVSYWIFENFPKGFKIASYVILILGISFYALKYYFGYLSFAVMELMMIAAMSVWFMIFVRTITMLDRERG